MAQQALDGVCKHFGKYYDPIVGIGKTPRDNRRINDLIYYAQGGGDFKYDYKQKKGADSPTLFQADFVHFKGTDNILIDPLEKKPEEEPKEDGIFKYMLAEKFELKGWEGKAAKFYRSAYKLAEDDLFLKAAAAFRVANIYFKHQKYDLCQNWCQLSMEAKPDHIGSAALIAQIKDKTT